MLSNQFILLHSYIMIMSFNSHNRNNEHQALAAKRSPSGKTS